MQRLVCHLIDSNADTAYFRSIAAHCDRHRYPTLVGSIAPEGPLQSAIRCVGGRGFSLRAASRFGYPLAAVRLARLLRRERVALLHAHCFEPTLFGLFAARAAGVRFVFTRHHSDHHIRMGKRWHTRIDGWCARRADAVIAVSEATRRVMTDIEGVPSLRIRVVYNGMEPLPVPTHEALTRTRQALGLGEQRVILVVGRLHEEKGHRVLFEALATIRSQLEPFVLLVAGDGPHRAQLEREAATCGLQSSVCFLGQRADVAELMSLATVVVAPSLAESFGYVVLEAMSLGRPVVATTTGGIPEVVGDTGGALLVAPGAVRELAGAIERLVADPRLGESLGDAGCSRARAFGFEAMIRGYERTYDEVFVGRSEQRGAGNA